MKPPILLGLILVLSCGDNGGASQSTDISEGTGSSQTADSTAATEASGAASGPTETSPGDTDPAGSGSASASGGSTTRSSEASGSGETSESSSGGATTGACMAKGGPAPVELGDADDLGAAGAYVVLAKSAVTNVPGTAITGGHVGVSPVAHTAITGFSLVLDPSGEFASSSAVTAPGRVYAADYGVPTPINLTTAVLAMQAAYSDAASRVPVDFLNLNDGDLGGLSLAPGVYAWGSTVTIPQDLTLEGCADDVWIFQISGDLKVSTSKQVLLAGGAQARHVFWQVAGQATIQVGAHLEGVILSRTGITFQTEASLHGRAYAQTMVALDRNAVTAP